jgi:hypothetical protein
MFSRFHSDAREIGQEGRPDKGDILMIAMREARS